VLIAVLLPASAHGDVVGLKSGSTVEGVARVIGEQVEVRLEDGGQVTFPRTEVAYIETTEALAEFALRAKKVRSNDLPGLKALARWAKSKGLESKSRATYKRLLAIDPKDTEAREGARDPNDMKAQQGSRPGASPASTARANGCSEICVRQTIGRVLVQSGTDSVGRPVYVQKAIGGVGSPEYNACVADCLKPH
jgi:hypothetical protein